MIRLLVRWLVLAIGVTLATKLVTGISCSDGTTLLVVVLVLSFFNAILKPILVLFSLPFIVLTMGIGMILINALLLYWAGNLVNGFHVASFGAAIWGGIVISLTNLVANAVIRSPQPAPKAPAKKRDDVIDI